MAGAPDCDKRQYQREIGESAIHKWGTGGRHGPSVSGATRSSFLTGCCTGRGESNITPRDSLAMGQHNAPTLSRAGEGGRASVRVKRYFLRAFTRLVSALPPTQVNGISTHIRAITLGRNVGPSGPLT